MQCYETAASRSFFLSTAAAMSEPEVYIELGGMAEELWPRELFVSYDFALGAIQHFLSTDLQDPGRFWIGLSGFPRRTVARRPRRTEPGQGAILDTCKVELMDAVRTTPKPTLAEYLAWEAGQPDRNEFFRGVVFAKVGGRRSNGRVVANLMRQLGNHLEGSPCQAFCENMKVQVGEDAILYPDVFVTCDDAADPDLTVFKAPVLVVEVLSPSTQRYDRSEKFAIYRRLASLREYVLIDPDTLRVEVFRPGTDGSGNWTLFDMSESPALTLSSVSCTIAMSALFDGVGR